MKKKDLIDAISENCSLPKKKTAELIDSIFDEILARAKRGDPYHHPAFGTFVISEKKERVIHNVTTRSLVTIPAKKFLRLVPSRRLCRKLNEASVVLEPQGLNE